MDPLCSHFWKPFLPVNIMLKNIVFFVCLFFFSSWFKWKIALKTKQCSSKTVISKQIGETSHECVQQMLEEKQLVLQHDEQSQPFERRFPFPKAHRLSFENRPKKCFLSTTIIYLKERCLPSNCRADWCHFLAALSLGGVLHSALFKTAFSLKHLARTVFTRSQPWGV